MKTSNPQNPINGRPVKDKIKEKQKNPRMWLT